MIETMVETPRGNLYVRRHPATSPRGRAPIVMFHDSLGCVDLWGALPARLAEATSREVIAYDRLGYGRSDPREDAPKADFFREEIHEFFPFVRRALGLERFVAFGHSVGGGMAITLGALDPAACVGLVSESAQAVVEAKTIAGIEEAKRALEKPDLFARLAAVHGDKTVWIIDAWSKAWLELLAREWTLTGSLPPLEVPLLVIHGADDEFGSMANPEALARWGGRKVRVEIFANTRHIPHRENRARVLELTRDFLEDLP